MHPIVPQASRQPAADAYLAGSPSKHNRQWQTANVDQLHDVACVLVLLLHYWSAPPTQGPYLTILRLLVDLICHHLTIKC
jgi:hypothetical protein